MQNLLRWLVRDVSGPWVVGRDFNEIVAAHEYMGKRFGPMTRIRDFGDALEECGLAPIPYTSYKYTWSNCWSRKKMYSFGWIDVYLIMR